MYIYLQPNGAVHFKDWGYLTGSNPTATVRRREGGNQPNGPVQLTFANFIQQNGAVHFSFNSTQPNIFFFICPK